MKKFTLAMSLLLGASSVAMADANTPPTLSSDEAPKTYVIISYRGVNIGGGAFECGIMNAPETENYVNAIHVGEGEEVPETAFWYFVPGDAENTMFIRNYAAGEDFGVSANPDHKLDWVDYEASWYVLPNGINECGLTISAKNPFEGTSCLDCANWTRNYSSVCLGEWGLSTGWHPVAGDWLGTTWIFLEADPDMDQDELIAAILDAYNDSHFGPLKTNAYEAIDAYIRALPGDLKGGLSAVRTEIENMTAAPGTDLNAIQTQINEMISEALEPALEGLPAAVSGKSFSIENQRRYALRNRENNKFDGAFLCIAEGREFTVEGADVDEETGEVYDPGDTIWTDVKIFNTCADGTLAKCAFTFEPVDGGFKLKNFANNAYVATPNAQASSRVYQTEDADEAGVFTLGLYTSGANSGVVLIAVDPLDPETGDVYEPADPENPTRWALNIDTNGNPLVMYYAADGGSTWALAEVDLSGVEGIVVDAENANAAVEMFNIQGVRVNPETATPGLYIRRQGNQVTKVLVK